MYFGRQVYNDWNRGFRNSKDGVDKERAAAIFCDMCISAIATHWREIASLGTFCSRVDTPGLYTTLSITIVLGTMPDSLICKQGDAGSLVSSTKTLR